MAAVPAKSCSTNCALLARFIRAKKRYRGIAERPMISRAPSKPTFAKAKGTNPTSQANFTAFAPALIAGLPDPYTIELIDGGQYRKPRAEQEHRQDEARRIISRIIKDIDHKIRCCHSTSHKNARNKNAVLSRAGNIYSPTTLVMCAGNGRKDDQRRNFASQLKRCFGKGFGNAVNTKQSDRNNGSQIKAVKA